MANEEHTRDLNAVLLKEIDLIQDCIHRMAKNSFAIRGWTVSLVAVILALLPKEVDLGLLGLVGMVATLCFWYIDGFFLSCERLYRYKYDWVIANRLQCSDYCYDLNPHNEQMWLPSVHKAPTPVHMMFTRTLIPIYLPLLLLSLLFALSQYGPAIAAALQPR